MRGSYGVLIPAHWGSEGAPRKDRQRELSRAQGEHGLDSYCVSTDLDEIFEHARLGWSISHRRLVTVATTSSRTSEVEAELTNQPPELDGVADLAHFQQTSPIRTVQSSGEALDLYGKGTS